MSRSVDTIKTIIIGAIASKLETPTYPREPINAAAFVMKIISEITYKEFSEIKRSTKTTNQ